MVKSVEMSKREKAVLFIIHIIVDVSVVFTKKTFV